MTANDYPGHYYHENESQAWSKEKFGEVIKTIQRKRASIDSKTLQTVLQHKTAEDIEFDLVGVDAAIANAFRRILIAEIPMMAIERVFMANNTSVIQDEVLAHRLGLIPIYAPPEEFTWPTSATSTAPTEEDTLVFNLRVACTPNPAAAADEKNPEVAYRHAHVYARDIVWEPQGHQAEKFKDAPIKALYPDILIAKLRPGQAIDCQMHAVLGVGQDHAKFSPVATATYSLLPTIQLTQPIRGADATKFQACFPIGVIGLRGAGANREAVVLNARKDTVSRECLRHDEFKNKVKLGRVRDHFIFRIESTGCLAPDELFVRSIDVLRQKALTIKAVLDRSHVQD